MNRIALFGATGNVGRRIAELLIERGIATPSSLDLYASPNSKGKAHQVSDALAFLKSPLECDFGKYALALFATDSAVSRLYAPKALAKGCLVIDSSSAFRMQEDVPLILSPVNGSQIDIEKKRLYSCPNCVASPIALAMKPLLMRFGIKRIVATSFQSVSGAGKEAIDELLQASEANLRGIPFAPRLFPKEISFNVIPKIDSLTENGYTKEEEKVSDEVQKILGEKIAITATCVRVPVLIGHSVSLAVELKTRFSMDELKALFEHTSGVAFYGEEFATPKEIEGSDQVHAGRVRIDETVPHGITLWLASDNLRRGAALDAVETAALIQKQLIERGVSHAAPA